MAKFSDKLLFLITSLFCSVAAVRADDADDIVKPGSMAPEFTITSTAQEKISLRSLRGHPVLLSFFATWCGPCRAELPHIDSEIWRPYKDRGLAVLMIGREHTIEELKNFKELSKLSATVCADTDRSVYGRYAKKIIPRTYLIDASGKVVYASVGFEETEFNKLKENVAKLVAPASQVRARETAPNPLKLANEDIAAGKLDSAKSRLLSVIAGWPENAQAHYLLATVYLQSKDYELAKGEYHKAIKHSDDEKLKNMAMQGLARLPVPQSKP